MSNDHAWLSFMIFVNSSARAGKDSYDSGSSRMRTHVGATGLLWSPSNEKIKINMNVYTRREINIYRVTGSGGGETGGQEPGRQEGYGRREG